MTIKNYKFDKKNMDQYLRKDISEYIENYQYEMRRQYKTKYASVMREITVHVQEAWSCMPDISEYTDTTIGVSSYMIPLYRRILREPGFRYWSIDYVSCGEKELTEELAENQVDCDEEVKNKVKYKLIYMSDLIKRYKNNNPEWEKMQAKNMKAKNIF